MAEPATADIVGDEETAGASKIELWLVPVLVVVIMGGWLAWRLTADLDDIEASNLAWGELWSLTWQHIKLTLASSLITMALAVPLGIALTRKSVAKAAPIVVGIANIGQAAPALGLFVLLAILWQFGTWSAIVVLTLYALLPVLRNTIVGLQGVDQTLVEAGRGMGMSVPMVLLRIELPLAVPVIMSGIRTALVLLVGTATLATFISAGGLGLLITTGITLDTLSVTVSGALLVAVLALVVEFIGRIIERVARPKGLGL